MNKQSSSISIQQIIQKKAHTEYINKIDIDLKRLFEFKLKNKQNPLQNSKTIAINTIKKQNNNLKLQQSQHNKFGTFEQNQSSVKVVKKNNLKSLMNSNKILKKDSNMNIRRKNTNSDYINQLLRSEKKITLCSQIDKKMNQLKKIQQANKMNEKSIKNTLFLNNFYENKIQNNIIAKYKTSQQCSFLYGNKQLQNQQQFKHQQNKKKLTQKIPDFIEAHLSQPFKRVNTQFQGLLTSLIEKRIKSSIKSQNLSRHKSENSHHQNKKTNFMRLSTCQMRLLPKQKIERSKSVIRITKNNIKKTREIVKNQTKGQQQICPWLNQHVEDIYD